MVVLCLFYFFLSFFFAIQSHQEVVKVGAFKTRHIKLFFFCFSFIKKERRIDAFETAKALGQAVEGGKLRKKRIVKHRRVKFSLWSIGSVGNSLLFLNLNVCKSLLINLNTLLRFTYSELIEQRRVHFIILIGKDGRCLSWSLLVSFVLRGVGAGQALASKHQFSSEFP